MYDASVTDVGGTITREKPIHSGVALDAVHSDAIALPDADDGHATTPTPDAVQSRLERRRPGPRIAHTNEALLPLLRGAGQSPHDWEATSGDDLAPANGIMTGLLISGFFWLAMFFLLH